MILRKLLAERFRQRNVVSCGTDMQLAKSSSNIIYGISPMIYLGKEVRWVTHVIDSVQRPYSHLTTEETEVGTGFEQHCRLSMTLWR
jgi:hypothetical protein